MWVCFFARCPECGRVYRVASAGPSLGAGVEGHGLLADCERLAVLPICEAHPDALPEVHYRLETRVETDGTVERWER